MKTNIMTKLLASVFNFIAGMLVATHLTQYINWTCRTMRQIEESWDPWHLGQQLQWHWYCICS